ncbi:MAG: hypothetical protein K8U57_35715 [Planctomycetes bacterium]|nr:hypothetical protein [Planctomycetota bacterium]
MPITHQKLMRRRITLIAPMLFVFVIFAYVQGVPPFTPTRWQARAALAEADLCKPDAPIERRNGKLYIGDIKCDLPNCTCWTSLGLRVHISYSWDISFSAPFGHWVASQYDHF